MVCHCYWIGAEVEKITSSMGCIIVPEFYFQITKLCIETYLTENLFIYLFNLSIHINNNNMKTYDSSP